MTPKAATNPMSEASFSLEVPQAPAAPDLVGGARRDVAAFGELYRRYYVTVFRCFRRHLFSREAAEDLTAEIFLRLVGRSSDISRAFR
jgi:DNA-directed RNA polymerase specialized sigma24 family protein